MSHPSSVMTAGMDASFSKRMFYLNCTICCYSSILRPKKLKSCLLLLKQSTSENQDPVMEHVDIALFFPKVFIKKN